MSELRTAWFIRKRSWISLPTYTTFSASQQFPKTQKKKNKLKKREKKNVFPKQTQGDGFDETVSSPKYIFYFWNSGFLFIYLFILFLVFCSYALFDWYELGWWVITRWRWSMMACKNSMWISMDLKKVNLSLPISFFFSFFN